MKLTEKKLKQIIAEELSALNELDPFGGGDRGEPMPPTDAEKAAQTPDPEPKKKSMNLSKLGDEMITVGRALKSSKVKGLDMKEIGLVSAIMANILEMASAKSAGTLMMRINALIEKNK